MLAIVCLSQFHGEKMKPIKIIAFDGSVDGSFSFISFTLVEIRSENNYTTVCIRSTIKV